MGLCKAVNYAKGMILHGPERDMIIKAEQKTGNDRESSRRKLVFSTGRLRSDYEMARGDKNKNKVKPNKINSF